jgi:hypothetical protein
MWKKLTFAILVVGVLGLTGVVRAELVARYPFDDGTADDRAYYYEDADGTYFGDAEVVDDPERGNVLALDGTGDYVKVLNNQVAEFSTESFTYAFWIKSGFVGDFTYFWKGIDYTGASGPDDLHGVNIQHDDSAWVRFTLYNYLGSGGGDDEIKARTDVPDANCVTGDWIHIACVRDADADELRFYINAKLEPTTSGDTNPNEDTAGDISNPGFLYIGCNDRGYPIDTNSTPFGFVNGEIDDFRAYNHALSVEELEQLASDYVDPNLASDPSPPDGSRNECNDVVLSWTAGDNAVTHNVYFGTDGQDVKDANSLDAEYRGNHAVTTYNAGLLESLQPGETYFWRIDEVGSSVWKGDVWKFRINDGKAHSPDPADGRRLVPVAQTLLGWGAGCQADSHDVYFGTDYNDVDNADTSSDAFKGNQGGTSWDPCSDDPCGLDYSTDYYWRIDEVNGATTWKGDTWSFRAEGAIFDPNLRLWYKLNETAGTTASDSSGRDYDGTLSGTSGWDANGHNNGCLAIEDNGYVTAPSEALEQIDKQITISVWLNTAESQRNDNVVITAGADWEDYYLRVSVPDDAADVTWRAGDDVNDVIAWMGGSPGAWAGEWNHFAFLKDENETRMEVYLNGIREAQTTVATAGTLANLQDRRIRIGAETDDDDSYAGKMDDLMIYDRALETTEIEAIFRGGNVGIAWAPRPYNGQTDVARDVELTWRPGNYAVSHDVYFGTDFDDVNDGTGGTSIGNQEPNAFDPCGAGLLEFDTTYYWRIDEVNGPNTWTGPVWSFTTAQFDIVDDFEAYDTGTNKIFNTWEDGNVNFTGSFIDLGVEPFDPAHTGRQSMLYVYDNTIKWDWEHYWSDGALPFDSPQDFTDADTKVLTLYFYGDRGNNTNDTEQMYVGLQDDSTFADVNYTDDAGQDMNDLKRAEWTEWNIELTEFSGVDPCGVTVLSIGFGDRTNTDTVGGEGTVYFDDIRLYISRCVPQLGPALDFSGNCIVDWADVWLMALQWLRTDANLSPVVNPGSANLVGHWKLDGNANDSSVYGNHGAIMGKYAWVAGHDNQAARFTDGRVLVPDAAQLKPPATVSAAIWLYHTGDAGDAARVLVKGGDNYEAYCIEMGSDNHMTFYVGDVNGERYFADSEAAAVFAYEWVHLAGTYDGALVKSYVNGQVVGDNNEAIAIPLSQDPNGLAIANRSDANNRPLHATVDDARVYNRALTAAEVGWLATDGTGYVGLNSLLNVYDTEPAGEKVINIRDLGVMLNSWLEKKYWP